MAALINGLKFATQLTSRNQHVVSLISVRRHGWNKDFKPGKFPETEAERAAAAKKYNLHPSEYRPYPNDGLGFGDYPHLPDSPIEAKDPYYPYDFPEHRRNFNEPFHAEYEFWREDRFGRAEPLKYSVGFQLAVFLGVMFGCFGVYWFMNDKRMFRPTLPKQLPGDGKPHYSFEPKH